MRITVIFISLCLVRTEQRSTPEDDSYVAAVLEYQVNADVDNNLQNYVQHIQEAAQQNADIVVFPEMTLTRGVRSVNVPVHGILRDFPVPALRQDLYDEILVNISTAARENQVYVVINVQEDMDCTSEASSSGELCPAAQVYLFNTNVVFDRTGAVIDRYRKINLFGEFTRYPALNPDLGTFDTDFGVTFGHFICFDLMFQVPAVQLVQKNNLTDVVFTTMWFSEMPFLTATQIQEAYAYVMDINFIASGANNVRVGSAGSGIYSGKAGALISTMPGVPTTRLLVSRVPKVPGNVNFSYPGPIYDNPADHDSLVLITDPSLPAYISRPLVEGFQEFALADKEVTCRFRVRLRHRGGESTHQYRAFVHDGTHTYAKRQVGDPSCLVAACKTSDEKTCSYKFHNSQKNVVIEELRIDMTTYSFQYNETLKCDNVVYYPSSMRNNKFPLSPVNFTYIDSKHHSVINTEDNNIKQNGGKEHVTFKINAPQDELVSFGIWGRVYTKDVHHIKDGYKYRAAAFSGVRSFSGVETGGSRVCAVFACTGDSIDTCGKRIEQFTSNTTAIFEELTIVAVVPSPFTDSILEADDSAFFPVSMDISIMPLEVEDFEYLEERQQDGTQLVLNLRKQEAELYSFAIWGRVFEWDKQDASPPSDDHDGDVIIGGVEENESLPGLGSVNSVCNALVVVVLAFDFLLQVQ